MIVTTIILFLAIICLCTSFVQVFLQCIEYDNEGVFNAAKITIPLYLSAALFSLVFYLTH